MNKGNVLNMLVTSTTYVFTMKFFPEPLINDDEYWGIFLGNFEIQMEWTKKLSNAKSKMEAPMNSTSWSLLGPRVEVGLMANFMKGIHIFPLSIVESFVFLFSTK